MPGTDIEVAGWGWPGAARKAHWFTAGEIISLCGKWMYSGPREGTAESRSSDDCAGCRRKLDAEAAS